MHTLSGDVNITSGAASPDAVRVTNEVAAAPAPKATSTGVRDSRVVVYIALALIALMPGLAGWAYGTIGEGTVVGVGHGWLLRQLDDIKFGEGLRFWLGVSGAAMMSLLLLYPLRKMFAQRFRVGGVGGWFHIHMIIGLLGPVLILYHCNFGWGALNANIALATMLAVAISGIIGQFVYKRVSAGFYVDKQTARGQLDAAIGVIRGFDGMLTARLALIERLESFEADLLTPRRGVIASIAARLRIEVRRRQFFREAGWLLSELARANNWPGQQHQQFRLAMRSHLGAYVSTARRAAGRSIREQLWARWRLFHLPLFLIMSVATVLHVAAVWDIDAGADKRADAADSATGTDVAEPTGKRRPTGIIQQQVRQTVRIESKAAAGASGVALTAGAREPQAGPPPLAAQNPQPGPARPNVDSVAALLEAEERKAAPETPADATLIAKPVAVAPVSQAQVAPPPIAQPPALVDKPKPAARTAVKVADLPPVAPAPSKRVDDAFRPAANPQIAAPQQVAPAAVPPTETKPAEPAAIYAELNRLTESQPMGLGAAKGATLAERLASLKSDRFDHSKTKFPLTGKHTKVACEDCHTKTIENTPTACIACHKKDDIHRGRRPDCARCHTTRNWNPK